ncbi:M15 family metallopeptidase [Alkalihalobacillus sp. APA_J-10(15)]|nr:M15 family metallopeptidase [Halalkalibacter sp. APA_J-10(15)]
MDYFFVSNDGATALWTVHDDWRKVAAVAKSLGFEWGGDWTSFKDYPRLQMTGGLSLPQLRNGSKPNLVRKVGS